jgi:MarR family transcriptional regulator, lower aerobic nicotinate degradation pathway regulator
MKPDTGDEVVDAVLRAAHRIRTSADSALREAGLSLSGYKTLRALADGELSMRELSDVLHVTPRSVTDLTEGLTARGFVERHAHPADRRITLLRLTPAGREQLAQARQIAYRRNRAAVRDLDANERQTLHTLLQRILPKP